MKESIKKYVCPHTMSKCKQTNKNIVNVMCMGVKMVSSSGLNTVYITSIKQCKRTVLKTPTTQLLVKMVIRRL